MKKKLKIKFPSWGGLMYRKSFIFQSYEHNDEFGNRFKRKLKTGELV